MKYLLPIILLFAITSCDKDNDEPAPQKFDDPNATGCNCTTFSSGPTFTGANYTFTPNVPDTNSTVKLTLRRDVTGFPVFDIESPKSKGYSFPIWFEKCPKQSDNAIYYFEFLMKNGRIVKGNKFQIWE